MGAAFVSDAALGLGSSYGIMEDCCQRLYLMQDISGCEGFIFKNCTAMCLVLFL